MATIKSKALDRQDTFINSITGQDFDFGLVMTQAFLKGIRDIGYKSTASALFESLDNSIQAEAGNIHVLFDFDKGKTGKTNPNRIAIVDDGHGMSKEMIRVAVLWGGSDRLDDRQGMGKYGYGLPSSCVSIGQQYNVFSKREDMDQWHSVKIDINAIAQRSPEYIDQVTHRVIAPEAKESSIPEFVKKYLDENELNLPHGTIVVIDKIDRLSKNSFKPLKAFLSLETGVTYRNYLRSTNIYIDGELVEAVDPLFTTEGFRFYDENDIKAEPLPSLEIKVQKADDKTKEGIIKIRYAYMPYGFLGGKESAGEQEVQDGDDESGDEEGRKSKSKRLTVRKHNNGIIFLRKGRQIDTIDSKCPWTKFQNNDRYVGVEVDFSPELDEEFSITTSKQQVVVSQRIWNILRDHGVYEAIATMRRRYKDQAEEAKRKKANELESEPEKRDAFVEDLMKESAREFEVDSSALPQHVKKEGEENLEKKVKKIAEDTGMPENVVKQELESQTALKPYKLEYINEEEGPFYRAEQVGGQVKIYINEAHRFYLDLFGNPRTNAFTKNALAMMVFILGHSELRVTDEKRRWYKTERNIWSQKLDSTLEALSKHFEVSVDDQVAAEEMSTAESMNSKN